MSRAKILTGIKSEARMIKSKNKNMKIGIDLDDVTIATLKDLTGFHNVNYDTNFRFEDHNTYALNEVWRCSEKEMLSRVYEFYNSPQMDKLLPVEGAINGISVLAKQHEIVFITSRPLVIKNKTIIWLQRYLPDLNLPVYFTNQFAQSGKSKIKKSDICKQLNVNLIIDDAPAYASDCANERIPVLLLDKPWNKTLGETEFITRVFNWREIVQKIANFSLHLPFRKTA